MGGVTRRQRRTFLHRFQVSLLRAALRAWGLRIRVHVVGIAPSRNNQSGFLVQEAESVRDLSRDEVATFMSRPAVTAQPATGPSIEAAQLEVRAAAPASASPPGPSPAVPSGDQDVMMKLEAVALDVLGGLSPDEIGAVLRQNAGVPRELDRLLLTRGSNALGGVLSQEARRLVRDAFFAACRAARPTE